MPSASTAPIIAGADAIDMQEEGSHGVLLLHGFGDTPQTLALLAKRLHRSGYSVFAPLLPGHGRSMDAFTRSRATDWIQAARESMAEMRARHEAVSVVGLSMGGALAVIVAATSEAESIALIAPYLGMPRVLRAAAMVHRVWGRFAGAIDARNPKSIRDPIEREKNLAYGAVTGSALYQLLRIVRQARRALPMVTAPTLIIQSREDPRIAPEVAEWVMKNIGAVDKKLVWTTGAGHIITVDYGRERVFGEVERWLAEHRRSGAEKGFRGRDSR
ncbi:MAG TPA: alpha/beta fold hydrolase [Gemmatimonadaceae bacterium]